MTRHIAGVPISLPLHIVVAYTAIIQLRHASVFYNFQKTSVGFFKLLNDRRILSVLPSHRSIRDSNPTVANRSSHKATSINPAWFILHVGRLMGYTTRAARLLYLLLYYILPLHITALTGRHQGLFPWVVLWPPYY